MKDKIDTISAAVKAVIDSYPDGHEFYGNEFKDDCVKLVPEAKDSYVDTFLKMARRHRRASYISIDRNNSLYRKVKVKSILEQIKAVIPKDPEPVHSDVPIRQGDLPFFSQGFLGVFFFFAFGLLCNGAPALGSDFSFEGRPLLGTSLIALKSSLVYRASCENGLRPALKSLLFIVSRGNLRFSAISEIVIPVIPQIIGILSFSLIFVHIKEHLSIHAYSIWVKIRNLCSLNGTFILTYCPF